jgi:hypothetical protein
MEKDKKTINEIVSNTTDAPDKLIIELENYVESERALALGFAFGFCCASLDTGKDPREIECPAFLDDALENLNKL